MKEYLAKDLIGIQQYLMQIVSDTFRLADLIKLQSEGKTKRGRSGIPAKLREVEVKVDYIGKHATTLGLRSTIQGALRLKQTIAETSDSDKIRGGLNSLFERFHDDIVDLVFFFLPAEKREYYQKTELFGDTFKLHFPTANNEVIEAANCFAFGRNTACVFHLMRALEVVLKSLFDVLSLPPLRTGERTWNGILRQIRDALDKDKNHPDHEFYESAYVFLAAAKNPIRNATMHVDASYDEESARTVLDSVGSFMRHVATKLKE